MKVRFSSLSAARETAGFDTFIRSARPLTVWPPELHSSNMAICRQVRSEPERTKPRIVASKSTNTAVVPENLFTFRSIAGYNVKSQCQKENRDTGGPVSLGKFLRGRKRNSPMIARFHPDRFVGYESSKSYRQRCENGFWQKYIGTGSVLDIGYRGGRDDALPICDGAIGLELGAWGYDGFNLPYADEFFGAVHASHVLEHVPGRLPTLREWWRVVREEGHLLLFVPHAYLYERRLTVPPSRWSPEHLRSYTPAGLLADIEAALSPNSYRVRHLADNDTDYRYELPIDVHPQGCLEIECVLQKITLPDWTIEA